MRKRFLVAAGAVCGLLLVTTAAADYSVRDGNGALLTKAAKVLNGVQHDITLLFGLNNGQPVPVNVDGSGNVGVNVQNAQLPTGAANAANQTAVQAAPGSSSTTAVAVQGVTGMKPVVTGRTNGSYTESVVAVQAATWTSAIASSSSRAKLILGDAVGLGCVYSFASGTPATGAGVPFSLQGTPGSYPIDDPAPTNAVQVKCTQAGNITVQTQ